MILRPTGELLICQINFAYDNGEQQSQFWNLRFKRLSKLIFLYQVVFLIKSAMKVSGCLLLQIFLWRHTIIYSKERKAWSVLLAILRMVYVICRAWIDSIVLTSRDEGHELSLSEEQTRMKKKNLFCAFTWYIIRRQFLCMTKFTNEEIKYITEIFKWKSHI